MKTGEIYNHALTNPKAKFKSSEKGPFPEFEAHFNEVGKLVTGEGKDESLVYAPYDMDWELVPREVTFMEAFEAWQKGNTIIVDRSSLSAGGDSLRGIYQRDKGNLDNPWWYARDIAYGKWFVE